MPEFRRGQTVRRVRGGTKYFPNGAGALVLRVNKRGGEAYVSVSGKHDGVQDGETWFVRFADLELVAPAEPVQQARRVVQRDVSVLPDGILAHTLWFGDGSFAVNGPGGVWEHFPAPPIPQPEPAP